MKHTPTIILPLMASIIILFGFSASGWAASDMIMLNYEPAGVHSDSCTTSVGVVTFKDDRPGDAIGQSDRGKRFYSQNLVTDWISRALVDELAGNGCRVAYHDSLKDTDTRYTVTGTVENAFIKQDSMMKYEVNMSLKVVLMAGGKQIMDKKYSGRMTTWKPPMLKFNGEVASEMLSYMLQQQIVPDLEKAMS